MKDTVDVLKRKMMRWVKGQAEEAEVAPEAVIDNMMEK
jgi:hypothetical protein